MRVSIIVDDRRVIVDGMATYLMDFDWQPFSDVHAVQADIAKDRAEIEFKTIDPDGDGPLPAYKPPNEIVRATAFAERFGSILEAFAVAPKGAVSQPSQHPANAPAPSADISALEARLAELEARNAELQRMVGAHNEAFQQLDKIAGDGQ